SSLFFFFFQCYSHHLYLHSFPTRRSSDLDRSRARRCVEACVYGTLDFVGYPRFPAPVEFIAAVIAYYVHPVNIQTACLIISNDRSEERFSRNAETELVCRLLLAKKNINVI